MLEDILDRTCFALQSCCFGDRSFQENNVKEFTLEPPVVFPPDDHRR